MPIPQDVLDLVEATMPEIEDAVSPGVSEEQIVEFERRTGFSVPDELAEWLKFANGSLLGSGGTLGIQTGDPNSDIESLLRRRKNWRQVGWIPIATDACGNFFLLDSRRMFGATHPILFWDHEKPDLMKPDYVVASGLWPFLRFLLEQQLGDERWPFDADYVLQKDTELKHCKDVALPWDAP